MGMQAAVSQRGKQPCVIAVSGDLSRTPGQHDVRVEDVWPR
jgi:hypothetical protein